MNKFLFLFFFFFLWFLSPILHFYDFASSHALGLFISIFLLYIFYFFINPKIPIFNNGDFYLLGLLFLLSHVMLTLFLSNGNVARSIFSIVLVFFMIYGALIFSNLIVKINSVFVHQILIGFFIFMILLWMVSLLEVGFLTSHHKSIFPYNEPSHFSLFFSPLFFYVACISRGKFRIVIIVFSLVLGILMPNLTIILSAVLIGLILYRYHFLILLSLIGVSFFYFYSDTSYFIERLDFSDENRNLSVLTYLQGWELSWKHFISTNGLGIGFQQLGFIPISTEYGDIIFSIIGDSMNVKDGSFTAAKILCEFGLFGLLFIMYYFKIFVSSCRMLNTFSNDKKIDSFYIFASCSIVTYFLEIFIRGIGYFSQSTFLFITSIFILINYKLKEISKTNVEV